MKEGTGKPIFVVGSPRSGTSILTWCIGQHPNILPQEESNWLGPFAVDAAVGYQRGSERGKRGQLSANFIEREEFLERFGETIDQLILSHRKQFESRQAGCTVPHFKVSRSSEEPKSRWVDGTPENCFYICGLRKLFPKAQFVHLVRDVTDVVSSLLNFFPDGGHRLVKSEQAAYEYWLRTVQCCVQAEQAYGPGVVYRLRYSDLIERSESAMLSLLTFLGEPYSSQCLEPLALRVNTSEVPPDFNQIDSATDSMVVARARKLSDELQRLPQPCQPSLAASDEMEAGFRERVKYVATVDGAYQKAREMIKTFHDSRVPSNLPADAPAVELTSTYASVSSQGSAS